VTVAEHVEPTPRLYWMIALILAVLTAAEVSIAYVDILSDNVLVWLLLALGAAKFVIVVGFFMHLKFDKPLYRSLFLVGAIGVIPLFAAVLLTFGAL
jgi:cytochrome c oxidase subunit 4